jgi:hypothetical protein
VKEYLNNPENMPLTGEFERVLSLLVDLLASSNSEIELPALLSLVERWSQDYDRAKKQDPADGCNQMHLVGAALCVLLHRCEALRAREYDLRGALGNDWNRVLLCDKVLAKYDIEELQCLVTALQLEFTSLYVLNEATGMDEGEGVEESVMAGFVALVDVQDICMRIMGQLGSLLVVKEKSIASANVADTSDTDGTEEMEADADSPRANIPAAAVRGLLDVDADGFCSVRTETFVFLLDALHSMHSLHTLLTHARLLRPIGELPELHAHHREASNETFFLHSMTSDCVIGTIAQYAHRFAHLFHSVSQAIYYNFPCYARQTQLSLRALQRENAPAVNVLSLLTELSPDIPVLFEHTGAGCRIEHARYKYSWVLWSHFVFMVDADMQAFVAADLRTLLKHAESK